MVHKDLHNEVVPSVDKEVEVREFKEVANLLRNSSWVREMIFVEDPVFDSLCKFRGTLPLQALHVLMVLGVFIASSLLLFLTGLECFTLELGFHVVGNSFTNLSTRLEDVC